MTVFNNEETPITLPSLTENEYQLLVFMLGMAAGCWGAGSDCEINVTTLQAMRNLSYRFIRTHTVHDGPTGFDGRKDFQK